MTAALLLLPVALLALYGLHRLGLWMESRGWIFYRKAGSGGSLGHAVRDLQSLLEPGNRHAVEERRAEREMRAGAEGPPDVGGETAEGEHRPPPS